MSHYNYPWFIINYAPMIFVARFGETFSNLLGGVRIFHTSEYFKLGMKCKQSFFFNGVGLKRKSSLGRAVQSSSLICLSCLNRWNRSTRKKFSFKNFWVQQILGSKRIGPKKFGSKSLDLTKILVQKNCCPNTTG